MIDAKEIEKEIKDSIKTKLNDLLRDEEIMLLIAQSIDTAIAERIPTIINTVVQKGRIDKLVESKYQEKFDILFEKELKQKTANAISGLNLPHEIGKHISAQLANNLNRASLPDKMFNYKSINWDGFTLSADAITEGTIENFISTGIQDAAKQIELTIVDQMVVVENNLVARSADIKEHLIANNVTVNNLKINGQLVLNEMINKSFVSLIKDNITTELSKRKIDIATSPIFLNDKEVLTENTLGSSIINSNLRKLGRLTELNVSGISQLGDTLLVTNSGKVGINTSEPEGALTIWDDDSELTIRRYKKKNMYIGTMTDTDLSLGVNNDIKLSIRKDGTVEVHHIEIGGLRISSSDTVPTQHGNVGELVIMTNSSENDPWAYRCLGGDRWKAIK